MGEQQISPSMFESHENAFVVRFKPCINTPGGHFAHTLLLQNGGSHKLLAINHSMMTKKNRLTIIIVIIIIIMMITVRTKAVGH